MFKEENRVWWYIAGIIVMMVVLLLLARDVFIPWLKGEQPLVEETPYVYAAPPEVQIDLNKAYTAVFHTNKGIIVVELYDNAAPANVNNFAFLAREGYYGGTLFHRLVPGFLLQGGDRNTLNDNPSDDGYGGPGYFVYDEVNWDALDFGEDKRQALRSKGYSTTPKLESRPLERYSLAMASSSPNTNGSQFFFVIANAGDKRLGDLNGMFTVIGRVTSGAEVLEALGNVAVDDPSAANPRPGEKLVLDKVEILEQ